jgi:NADPH:quinone reductase-like Zn-dependent oxidoreductase
MKAVLLYSYGDPSQLRYEETAVPKCSDNEVLVKVRATSINPIDLKLRSGSAKSRMPLTLPAILGKTSPVKWRRQVVALQVFRRE